MLVPDVFACPLEDITCRFTEHLHQCFRSTVEYSLEHKEQKQYECKN